MGILVAHGGTVVGIDDAVAVDILILDVSGLLGGNSVVRISAHDRHIVVEVLLGEQAVGDIEIVCTDGVPLAADGIAGDELASRDIEPLVAVVGESSAYGKVGVLVEILVVGNTDFKAPGLCLAHVCRSVEQTGTEGGRQAHDEVVGNLVIVVKVDVESIVEKGQVHTCIEDLHGLPLEVRVAVLCFGTGRIDKRLVGIRTHIVVAEHTERHACLPAAHPADILQEFLLVDVPTRRD